MEGIDPQISKKVEEVVQHEWKNFSKGLQNSLGSCYQNTDFYAFDECLKKAVGKQQNSVEDFGLVSQFAINRFVFCLNSGKETNQCMNEVGETIRNFSRKM